MGGFTTAIAIGSSLFDGLDEKAGVRCHFARRRVLFLHRPTSVTETEINPPRR